MQHRHRSLLLLVGIALLTGACSPALPALPTSGAASQPVPSSASAIFSPQERSTPAPPATSPQAATITGAPSIVIQASAPTRPFDRRLLGINVPAWLNPDGLANEQVRVRTAAMGATLLRLPGGSWSNGYDWLACELKQPECTVPWAARPTDFLNFLRATGIAAMWTVSINATAQEAAALVAFFNGQVDDETPIGVDVRGRDWYTVGHWARLRAEQGNPEPYPIRLWEVGNEVYGGKPSAGPECAAWGWEDVWTCDGTEYVQGKGDGAGRHEGYLEIRAAMRAVDPGILVGAVGVEQPGEWGAWGNEVIAAAGADLDFYVIHHYPYFDTPGSAAEVLERPAATWEPMMRELRAAFEQYAGGRRAPIAVTEYNIVAWQDLDNGQLMRRSVNAFFMADTIGQMAEHGVAIANQWNLANGIHSNGTDYGLINIQTGERSPAYYAFVLWSRFGDELLPVRASPAVDEPLQLYAGRGADGMLSLLAINPTGQPVQAHIRIDADAGPVRVTRDELRAESLEAMETTFNGVAAPADDLSDAPPRDGGTVDTAVAEEFAPFSITLVRLWPER